MTNPDLKELIGEIEALAERSAELNAGLLAAQKSAMQLQSEIENGAETQEEKSTSQNNSLTLEELKKDFATAPEVHFAGVQGGETLAGLYADADFLLFPSTTDTFGNVVVEALASGTPAIVTDMGGPQDIVFEKGCGEVLPADDTRAWLSQIEKCVELRHDEAAYQKVRENAYERSKDYTLEKAAKAQWEFYKKVYHEAYLGK